MYLYSPTNWAGSGTARGSRTRGLLAAGREADYSLTLSVVVADFAFFPSSLSVTSGSSDASSLPRQTEPGLREGTIDRYHRQVLEMVT